MGGTEKRQKAFTLAKKAGVELKAVCFTRKELLDTLSYDPGKKYGTKHDHAWGRAFIKDKVIWLSLPANLNTIAEEIMHLAPRNRTHTHQFYNRVLALQRGYNPAKIKPHDFEVTITTKYKVFELTAHDAKERYRRGQLLDQHITAKSIK